MNPATPSRQLRIIIWALLIGILALSNGYIRASEWRGHTAFDCQPRKIMDTGRFVYVWVMQVLYTNCFGSNFNTPRGGLIYFDRQQPEQGFRSIHERAQMHTGSLRTAAYNPGGKYLLAVYFDGTIEILTDGGDLYRIEDFRNMVIPYDREVRHICFPLMNDDAWIATASGYIHIDGDNYKVAGSMSTDFPIQAICRVGNRIVAISGGHLYTAPADAIITTQADFTDHGKDIVEWPDVIMPLDDNSFATLYKGIGPADNLGIVSWADSGTPVLEPILSDPGFSNQMIPSASRPSSYKSPAAYNVMTTLHNENNILPTSEGYMVFSRKYAYHINRTKDTGGNPIVRKRKFAVESPFYTASADFNEFWFYRHRKGFQTSTARNYDDHTTWSDGPVYPYHGAPVTGTAVLLHHPEFGVIISHESGTRKNDFYDSAIPLLIGSYKNGIWTNHSPSYHLPESCLADDTLMGEHLQREEGYMTYPLTDPSGFAIDTSFPDYLWMGSFLNGIAAVNLRNPPAPIFHFGTATNQYSHYPGFKASVPVTSWNIYCPWRMGGCDADGVLWTLYVDSYDTMGDGDAFNFAFLTADDRRAAMESGRIEDMGDWKWITHPRPGVNLHGYSTLLPLRHTKNRNKLAIGESGSRTLVIFDHNGTLGNPSDDRSVQIEYVDTPSGIFQIETIFSMAEDPVSGNLLVGGFGQIFSIDTGSLFNETDGRDPRTRKGDLLRLSDGTPACGYQRVNTIAFDEYNRCWLGLEGGGVIGISADRKEITARYDTGNSPLPSDDVYGLCWNPDSKELMISTYKGIVSVCPDVPDPAYMKDTITRPYAFPEVVNPSYAGAVVLHNIPSASALSVIDKSGNIIAHLPGPEKNATSWNLLTGNGDAVTPGIYKITDSMALMPDIEITVVR